MPEIKTMATGIVIALVGVMVGYLLFGALFEPVNQSVTDLNQTLSDSGYTTEAKISTTAWKFYLLAIPLVILGGGVYMIVNAFKG
jgi:cell division protein FtsX